MDGARLPPAIPPLGFGTSQLGDAALDAIATALELGYRHLDTAQTYGTEALIGEAIRRTGKKRGEVFLTTKVADINLSNEKFMPSLRQSLDRLGVDHVDLLLIHWPSHRDAVPFGDYMASLARAKADGLATLIGVSNFPIVLIDRALDALGPGEIATNQVELHPYLQNRRLRDYCRRKGVAVTAYMPLAKGKALADPVIREIAARRGVTPAAATLAWLLQAGIIAIPASSKRENMAANLAAASLRLSEEDMAAIDRLDRGERMINPAKAPVWDEA